MPGKGAVTACPATSAMTCPASRWQPISVMCYEFAICRSAQDTLRVAIRLTGIRVRTAAPVHPSEHGTAAGLDDGLAVHAGLKPGTQSDVQAGAVSDRFRGALGHAPVHDHRGMQRFGRSAIRVHQDRDLLFAEHHQDAEAVGRIRDAVCGDTFDGDFPGVDRLGEGDRAP